MQDNFLSGVVYLYDKAPEEVSTEDAVDLDAGYFIKFEVIFGQYEDRAIDGAEVVELQFDPLGKVGIQFGLQIGSDQGKGSAVVDLEDIGDLSFGQDGMFRSGIENKGQGENIVEEYLNQDEVIDVLKRNLEPGGSFSDLKIGIVYALAAEGGHAEEQENQQ